MTRVRPTVLAATVILFFSLVVPVAQLFQGSAWVGWYGAFGLIVFAAGLIGRNSGLSNALVGVVAAALVPPALIAAFAADVAWLWIIPNSEVWGRFVDLSADLLRAIELEASPLTAGPWISAFAAVLGAVLAWVFDWYVFTVKAPAATGLFAGLVAVVAVAFVRPGLPLTAFAPMALAYLALLAVTGDPPRPRLAASAVVAGAAALGLVAGLTTPGLGTGGFIEGTNRKPAPVGGRSPLVDLGKNLRTNPSTEALRYTSDVGPLYMRLTTLGEFDGTTWTHRPGRQVAYRTGQDEFAPLPGTGTGTAGKRATVSVEITGLDSEWLPVPYQPVGLSGGSGTLRVDQDDLTIAVGSGQTQGRSYQVSAWLADPDSAQARQSAVATLSDEEVGPFQTYTWLPDDLPEIIGETAREVAWPDGPDSPGPLDQALALERFFHESGFTYSLSTPVREGYDGDSGEVVAKFLEVKAGYCAHFAVAMTLMARELGIPARVAVGYLPGNSVGNTGQTAEYSVAADRLHAWPELYIRGSGWVGFEPTVSRGSPSTFGSATPEPPAPSSRAPSPSASRPPSASPSTSAAASPSAAPRPPDRPNDPNDGLVWWVWCLAVFAALAACAAAPGLVRTVVRQRRLSLGLAAAWSEVAATAVDLGLDQPLWRTPAAMAAALVNQLDSAGQAEAARALERLEAAVEVAAYAPPTAPNDAAQDGPSQARTALRGLRLSQPWRIRLVAWWAPRSMRPMRSSAVAAGSARRRTSNGGR
ncbi:MAG: DUF3488 and transglutaminase-like domain-containing protein [Bifidobacteriaceae bacterium]|jgi:transglutaminase-like putative cysteine protease|nr:DUF3488 and transglutaminase-like domain-containing protein [Bifidobacteriaceae bacterium]